MTCYICYNYLNRLSIFKLISLVSLFPFTFISPFCKYCFLQQKNPESLQILTQLCFNLEFSRAVYDIFHLASMSPEPSKRVAFQEAVSPFKKHFILPASYFGAFILKTNQGTNNGFLFSFSGPFWRKQQDRKWWWQASLPPESKIQFNNFFLPHRNKREKRHFFQGEKRKGQQTWTLKRAHVWSKAALRGGGISRLKNFVQNLPGKKVEEVDCLGFLCLWEREKKLCPTFLCLFFPD